MTETRTMHLTLREPAEPAELQRALRQAGFHAEEIREVTDNHHGYILTNTRAMGIWNQETGWTECRRENPDGCSGRPAHAAWRELTPEQQRLFMDRYVQFLENCRNDELLVAETIGENHDFNQIALSPRHGHQD